MPPHPADRPGLDAGTLTRLRLSAQGRVLAEDDPAYDRVHRVWNHDRQQRPAVIVECQTSDDVVLALHTARENDRPFAVRGAGYAPAGTSVRAGGVVADLRPLRHIELDLATRTVVVGAGATWAEVNTATQRHGLIVAGLAVPGIGVAGSTLTGGHGLLRRTYGLACDNLASAEVVTASGERVTVSGDQNSELLWGLRGGGGNFGAVTSLRFRLRALPEPVMGGACFYPADHAADLLRFYRTWTADLRDDITTRFTLLSGPHTVPALQRLPRAPMVAITVVCTGPSAEAERLVQPLRDAAPLAADHLVVQPYVQSHHRYNDVYPFGDCAEVASEYLGGLDDDTVDTLMTQYLRRPEGACEIRLDHMGGAVSRVPRMSTAVPHRDAPYVVTTMGRWTAGSDGAAIRAWVRATHDAVSPHGLGGPMIGMDNGDVPAIRAYGGDLYLRLSALKHRFDPDNVFASNLNISPLA